MVIIGPAALLPRPLEYSPVPWYQMCWRPGVVFWAMHDTLWSCPGAVVLRHVAPPFVDFHMPEETPPARITLSLVTSIDRALVRPPTLAGPRETQLDVTGTPPAASASVSARAAKSLPRTPMSRRNDSRPGIPQAHPLVLHPSRGVLVGAVGRPRPGRLLPMGGASGQGNCQQNRASVEKWSGQPPAVWRHVH